MTTTADILKAPFPAFGGKSQVADLVWERIGDVRNYIEPFAFSAAMLLRRPSPGPIETINDLNCYVSNFWRAIKAAPEEVAEHADWPVNEADLHARHRWLVLSADAQQKLQRVREEPDYFDARIAGWWCWGACCWIGSGWCDETHRNSGSESRPDLDGGQLVTALTVGKRPQLCTGNTTGGPGVHRVVGALSQQTPRLSAVGQAIHSGGIDVDLGENHRPQLADAFSRGRGVNGNDALGTCEARRRWLVSWFGRLADRFRPVRVCCGQWMRVCDSPSTLTRLGTTGVFLDPPYRHTIDGVENRSQHIYANDKHQDVDALCDEVSAWCLKWGGDAEIRIVLCGLEGEYPAIEAAGWEIVPWKSRGGYGNRSERGKENAARERLWISPHCLKTEAGPLFGVTE